jgi:Carboxypeptidase regulatory-like domain
MSKISGDRMSLLSRAIVLASATFLSLILHAQSEPQLHPVQISGRVVRSDNGLPVQNAIIALMPLEFHGEVHEAIQTARTDRNGEYQFSEVKSGFYRIFASAAGFTRLAYRRDRSAAGALQKITASTVLRGVDFRLVADAVNNSQ